MPTNVDKFFEYAHLPPKLQTISQPIGDLAKQMDAALPDGPEKSAGMRKLLEAKDCFVRAALVLMLMFLASCVSQLDKPAAAANLANVRSLVAENSTYTAADATLPESLKATRSARNDEAVKLAENLAK